MSQSTYPPPTSTTRGDLAATSKATAREIHRAPFLLAFFASKQRKTLGALREVVGNIEAALLYSYTEEDILHHTGPLWSFCALETAISKGPHASTCTPENFDFIWREMQQKIQDGFSILLPAADTVWMFGAKLNLSCTVAVTQAH